MMKAKAKAEVKGQSVIEVSCVLLGLILALKGMFLVFQLTAGALWVDHQVYQHLICLAEGRSQTFCREKLIKTIIKFNPAGAVSRLQVKKGMNRWEGRVKWTVYGVSRRSGQTLILP